MENLKIYIPSFLVMLSFIILSYYAILPLSTFDNTITFVLWFIALPSIFIWLLFTITIKSKTLNTT